MLCKTTGWYTTVLSVLMPLRQAICHVIHSLSLPSFAFSGGFLIWVGDPVELSMERYHVHRATLRKVLFGSMIEHYLAEKLNLWTTDVLLNDTQRTLTDQPLLQQSNCTIKTLQLVNLQIMSAHFCH